MIKELAIQILKKTPESFDEIALFENFPTKYEESMNTVLVQEVQKYNILIRLMKESLNDVQLALLGEVVMSEDLEKLAESLFNNQVRFHVSS